MSDIKANHLSIDSIIEEILRRHFSDGSHKVFIFGSRAKGSFQPFSDYDIGIEGPRLSPEKYFEIAADFEESNLPVCVDLVQMCDVSDEFRALAKKGAIPVL